MEQIFGTKAWSNPVAEASSSGCSSGKVVVTLGIIVVAGCAATIGWRGAALVGALAGMAIVVSSGNSQRK